MIKAIRTGFLQCMSATNTYDSGQPQSPLSQQVKAIQQWVPVARKEAEKIDEAMCLFRALP